MRIAEGKRWITGSEPVRQVKRSRNAGEVASIEKHRRTDNRLVRTTLNLDLYVPFLITSISNRLTRAASRFYLDNFGIGIVEWRILVHLAIKKTAAAKSIVQMVSLDKAAVSRAIQKLSSEGYISETADQDGKLRYPEWEITDLGWQLHDRILPIALERQKRLLAKFSEADRRRLLGYLDALSDQLDYVNDFG